LSYSRLQRKKKKINTEKSEFAESKEITGLSLGHAALEGQENQVGAAADAEFAEEIGDVKFHGALGNVEFAGDFLVREVFEKRVEDFLLAAAEICYGICFQAATLARENGIDKAGKNGAWNPEATIRYERESANQLFAGFRVSQETFDAEAEKLIAVGVGVLFADDDQARFGMAFENVGQESASGGTGSVAIDNINLRDRRFEIAHVGGKRGFELFGGDFELRLRQYTFEFAQHQRVRRKNAD
jgi:hypothetical protein